MSWCEKDRPTPFDNKPIEGLFFIDGDALARSLHQDWTRGKKYAMVAFPSGDLAIWASQKPEEDGIIVVHLFDEMDLPYRSSRDKAFKQASSIAKNYGYTVNKVGDNQLELWGRFLEQHLMITYGNEGCVANVEFI